ncbi:hypothetical protein AAFC00_002269 [Neodothiora populina]|uniref:Uncharacterized protein n=1 Tax=Neodothiora populina TaxID=2781224 RepID=A0ABR3PH34_9PEZI
MGSNALSTITSPMSAIFTPPSSCSLHWTFEPASANSMSGGLLLQDAQFDRPDKPCYPPGFGGWGRAPSFIQVFSPGACPSGYTTAYNNFNIKVTTAVCCPSNFVYTSSIGGVNEDQASAGYYGCTSMYSNVGATTVFAEVDGFSSISDGTATMFARVTGPVTMWAQPITVAFQPPDLSLFSITSTVSNTAASASISSSSSSPMTTTKPSIASSTAISSAASTSPTGSSSSTTSSSSPSSTPPTTTTQPPNPGLSVGAIAGIVISASAVLATIIGAAIYFRSKRNPTTPSSSASNGRKRRTRLGFPDRGYWHQHPDQNESIDKLPRPLYPHHELYYHFHQRHKQPEELDGREWKQLAELPYHGDRLYELPS